VDGNVVTLRLEGKTRTEMERPRKHALDMRLLGEATYDLKRDRFLTFELVALGSRWGGTQLNGRWRDTGAAPIGILSGWPVTARASGWPRHSLNTRCTGPSFRRNEAEEKFDE